MKFDLVDQIIEQGDDQIVTIKQVSQAEEYLGDHFPSFPILPGVLMLESMVQAASRLLSPKGHRLVLGDVKAVKYGAMVRPGEALRVEVHVMKSHEDGSYTCKGKGIVISPHLQEERTAVAGRFTIRPARLD